MTQLDQPSAAPPFLKERRKKPRRPFRKTRRPEERVHLLGAGVDLVRPEEVIHEISTAIAAKRQAIIANHNLHSIYLYKNDAEYRAFFDRAALVEVDSAPMIMFARLLGLQSRPFHRCTYLDWRELFWTIATRNQWRVFYLGGEPGVAARGATALMNAHPGVQIETHHGYFDAESGSADNAEILARIEDFAPDILFVGMGMPRQELWIYRQLGALPDCVILSVGAAFDYEANAQRAAPRWMGRLGLEWLYRLACDPRRLFSRYCIEPWSLLDLAAADIKASLAGRMGTRVGQRAGGRNA